jgi:hypothetical protein
MTRLTVLTRGNDLAGKWMTRLEVITRGNNMAG